MNLKDLSKWMNELQATVGRCNYSLQTVPGDGLRFQIEWMKNGVKMGYERTMSGAEVKHSNDNYVEDRMEQMKHEVIELHERPSGHQQ